MNRAMPYTMHLNGIAGIFHQRFSSQSPSEESRELAALIGALDLPTHIVGRQTKNLNMWHQHCMGQTGLEEITGLPCSLLDLFASHSDHDIEQRLLQWPGEPGEPVMCKTWEATQYAGLIRVRDLRAAQGLPIDTEGISTSSLVQHVFALMRDLRMRLDVNIFATTDIFFLPMLAVGSQAKFLTEDQRVFVREGISALSNHTNGGSPYYDSALHVLERLWAGDVTRSVEYVAKEMGLELGLY